MYTEWLTTLFLSATNEGSSNSHTSGVVIRMKNEGLTRAIELLGSQSRLAEALAERGLQVCQAQISNWLHRDKFVPAQACPHIECLTNGVVTREQLRPDVFAVKCSTE
jgi:DNA-binding transcriptional regulator YdaS (Cro superfamily)